jgi:hypothetical protein
LGASYLIGPAAGIVEPGTRYAQAVVQIALNKASLEPLYMFVRGVVGNWLICMSNFYAVMNKSFQGKCLGIGLGITMFGTIGYDHAVANWGIMTMAKIVDPTAFSWTLWFYVVVLTTIGNMVGGVIFMGFPAALTIYLDKIYYNKVKKDKISPSVMPHTSAQAGGFIRPKQASGDEAPKLQPAPLAEQEADVEQDAGNEMDEEPIHPLEDIPAVVEGSESGSYEEPVASQPRRVSVTRQAPRSRTAKVPSKSSSPGRSSGRSSSSSSSPSSSSSSSSSTSSSSSSSTYASSTRSDSENPDA